MSEFRDRQLEDSLAGWDPARHVDPLDPAAIAGLRHTTLAGLRVDAGETDLAPWLRLAIVAAASLALAFALWSAWGPEAIGPQQARDAVAAPPVTASVPIEPAPAAPAVAGPPLPVDVAVPSGARVAPPTRSANRRGPARRSRLDFRTARGTRVIWVMRSDFEPPSNHSESF